MTQHTAVPPMQFIEAVMPKSETADSPPVGPDAGAVILPCKCGPDTPGWLHTPLCPAHYRHALHTYAQSQVDAAVVEERERCAKIADDFVATWTSRFNVIRPTASLKAIEQLSAQIAAAVTCAAYIRGHNVGEEKDV